MYHPASIGMINPASIDSTRTMITALEIILTHF